MKIIIDVEDVVGKCLLALVLGILLFAVGRLSYLEVKTATQAEAIEALKQDSAAHRKQTAAALAVVCDIPQLAAEEIVAAAHEAAQKRHVDPTLVLAVIVTESRCRQAAQSNMGAVGLMQVRASVWVGQVVGSHNELLDAKPNIHAGTEILARYRAQTDDWDMALTMYNRGPAAIRADLLRGRNPANGFSATVWRNYRRLGGG